MEGMNNMLWTHYGWNWENQLHCLDYQAPNWNESKTFLLWPDQVLYAGLKKVPTGLLQQVDSPSGQVPFHSNLFQGQGIKQVVFRLIH